MRLRLIVATIVLCSASFVAKADTVNFTYAANSSGVSVSGSGSFSFSGSPSSVTLSDLTAFSFTDTITDGGSSNFSYGLGNLTSFDATFSGSSLQTLSLQTGFVGGSNMFYFPESFTITSLGTNGADTHSYVEDDLGGPIHILTSTGTVTASVTPEAVPEPSSIALLGTGLLGFAGMVRRRLA